MIHTASPHRRVLAFAGFIFATSLVLTGCANPVEKLVEAATSDAPSESTDSPATDSSDLDVEFAEIPADFPDGVPLPDVKPTSALAQTIEGKRQWIIHFEENVNDQVFEDLQADFIAEGFAEVINSGTDSVMSVSMYENDGYTVSLNLIEGKIMQLTVMEA